MTATLTQPDAREHIMQCMEVWGGLEAAESAVSMPGLDVWVVSRPHAGDDQGGDVHYVSSCATGRITRLLLADVSGHGQSIASFAVRLRGLMRRYVNYMNQSAFVKMLNREFLKLSKGGVFATAVVATYFAPTSWLVICNAGHPRPLRYDAASGRWSALSSGARSPGLKNLPLGVVAATDYDQFGLTLAPGDFVLVHTDSITEVRDESGVMLGEAGLLSILNDIDATDPDALIAELQRRVLDAHRGDDLDDDMTLMLLRYNEVKPRTFGPKHLPEIIAGVGRSMVDGLLRR